MTWRNTSETLVSSFSIHDDTDGSTTAVIPTRTIQAGESSEAFIGYTFTNGIYFKLVTGSMAITIEYDSPEGVTYRQWFDVAYAGGGAKALERLL